MVQVTVKIDYLGKSYQTNVLAKREEEEEEIFRKALEQVEKQWTD
ncbi:BA3454 family stress response protein [Peribacillus glennii]|uniref:BA3454 family stress response protein n=1 Tax=Peribacillus glennii TaxID=2303991 RepID=A0A372LBC6_9BACI|nr:BA3454 family stress response protein [Peribacillus glennii]RFU62867.1 BA3454 family stress response protein [Peribacillus glennii]